MSSLLSALKNFDAYPKTLEDFREKTASGAIISFVAGIIIVWLFVSEFLYFLKLEVRPQLFVDTTRGEKLRINMDIVFHNLPCGYLSVDAMDISGDHQLDVDHNIFKKRVGSDGNALAMGPERQQELGEGLRDQDAVATLPPNYCGSCYGSLPGNACCNTCAEVQEAYRKKGWSFSSADSIEQCKREGWSDKMAAQQGEGCQVYGYLLVNKVAGNFHVAPGKSFQQHHMHVHDLQPIKDLKYNLSHTINKLSFGKEFPGVINPLDGVSKGRNTEESLSGLGMYQYFVKVVPTIYEGLGGRIINTNQFSVTEHFKGVSKDGTSHGLPGLFFMYELSPIMVKFVEERRSFTHFLTGVCAIIGGVFTVAGIIDAMVYHSLRSLKKKVELGKQT